MATVASTSAVPVSSPPTTDQEREIEIIDLTELTESSEEEDGAEDEMSDTDHGDEGEGGHGEEDDDDASYVEISVDEHSRAQLHAAVATVSETRLRHILSRLIGTNPAVEEALLRELITVERNTKKVIPRFETCENCDDEFEVDGGQKDDCVFHPGDLHVNEKAFVDWDEDVHGEMDHPQNRRQYPENFLWSCCDKDGRTEGCVRGEHKPAQSQSRKRRRI